MKIVRKNAETDTNYQSIHYEGGGVMWFEERRVWYSPTSGDRRVEVFRRYGKAGWYVWGDETETRYPSRLMAVICARIG